MNAKKYVLDQKLDERIFIELIAAFANIYNLDQVKELLNLMKPGYEKAMAMSLVGKELFAKKNISEMEYLLTEATKRALMHMWYSFQLTAVVHRWKFPRFLYLRLKRYSG